MIIAVEVPNLQTSRLACEVVEDRTLLNTVPAPGPGNHNDQHVASKTGQQFLLGPGQRDHVMEVIPPATLLGGSIFVEEFGVFQAIRPCAIKIHGAPLRQEPCRGIGSEFGR